MPRISDVPQPDDPRKVEQAAARKAQEARRSTNARASNDTADTVEVSSKGREGVQIQQRLADAARNTPDVRQDRVEAAKQKLRSGEYDSEEVRQTIADRILEQFGVS